MPGRTPVDHIEVSLRDRTLDRAFRTLPAKDRVVLTLRYHMGLPTAETAQLLRIPDGTVKSRVHHAIEKLRAAYDAVRYHSNHNI